MDACRPQTLKTTSGRTRLGPEESKARKTSNVRILPNWKELVFPLTGSSNRATGWVARNSHRTKYLPARPKYLRKEPHSAQLPYDGHDRYNLQTLERRTFVAHSKQRKRSSAKTVVQKPGGKLNPLSFWNMCVPAVASDCLRTSRKAALKQIAARFVEGGQRMRNKGMSDVFSQLLLNTRCFRSHNRQFLP